jgi:hypothetical protein
MLKNKMIMGAVGMAMFATPVTGVYAETNSNVPVLTQTESQDVDNTETGSITIQLEKSDTATDLSNVKFAITKIANITNGEYVLEDAYQDSKIDLNTIENADELQKVATKFADIVKESDHTVTTSTSGLASLTNLRTGIYLITVTDKANYDNVSPTIVSVPTYQDIVGYNYDITVEPKHSPSEKPEPPETPKEDEKEKPDTGVYSNTNQYMMGAGVSMACIAFLILAKKKNEEDGEAC